MRTLAALLFIAAAAAAAVYLAQRPTIARGSVMAADLMEQLPGKGITKIDCDDEIPIGIEGAVFVCQVGADDGSTAKIQYRMSRERALSATVLESTGPTRQRAPASGDPWSH